MESNTLNLPEEKKRSRSRSTGSSGSKGAGSSKNLLERVVDSIEHALTPHIIQIKTNDGQKVDHEDYERNLQVAPSGKPEVFFKK